MLNRNAPPPVDGPTCDEQRNPDQDPRQPVSGRLYAGWSAVINNGNQRCLCVLKNGRIVAIIPLGVGLILLLLLFWLLIPAGLLLLLCGYRYRWDNTQAVYEQKQAEQ